MEDLLSAGIAFWKRWNGSGRRSSGQAALEYFIMLSVALLVAAPIIMQAQQTLIHVRTSSRVAKVQNALDTIEEGVRLVRNQGAPARTTFTINLPARINQSEVGNRYIYYQLRTPSGMSDYYRVFGFNVTGSLPTSPGVHVMRVVARDDYVNISEQ
ncbi:MAG: hypothetical protein SVU32_01355 [Candidatus Nanohaloarchaea archaeon]|nr:hypothetical protein [Candidatus Nanohaloarchaea archaeon]